jgi:hypothetical protein
VEASISGESYPVNIKREIEFAKREIHENLGSAQLACLCAGVSRVGFGVLPK